jgi:hypothetical protein
MPDGSDEKPKWKKGNKAQNLLARFPITDLAKAVVFSGSNRTTFLKTFVDGGTTKSYLPTRDAWPMIYASQKPMFDMPPPAWDDVEKFIRKTAHADILRMNLDASRCLFDFVRSLNYQATDCDPQVLRVRLKNVVPINLSFYVTNGERLIFQFPLMRIDRLSDGAITVIGSILHHAYVQGDYSGAEIEIADISRAATTKDRSPRIKTISQDNILDREALTEQIDEVYEILRDLASRPPPPSPPNPGGEGFL